MILLVASLVQPFSSGGGGAHPPDPREPPHLVDHCAIAFLMEKAEPQGYTSAGTVTVSVQWTTASPDPCGAMVHDWSLKVDGVLLSSTLTRPAPNKWVVTALAKDLKAGPHTVSATISAAGMDRGSTTWTFTSVRCDAAALPVKETVGTQTRVGVRFGGDAKACPALSFGMRVNGAPVSATFTASSDGYAMEYVPPAPFGGGNHTAVAWVDACCLPDGRTARGEATWTWDVPDCGSNPLRVSDHWPRSAGVERPTYVMARFRDADVACPLASWWMTVDGERVAATLAQQGNEWEINYTPPGGLPPSLRTSIEVGVVESCCNAAGRSNEGSHQWDVTPLQDRYAFDAAAPPLAHAVEPPRADPCADLGVDTCATPSLAAEVAVVSLRANGHVAPSGNVWDAIDLRAEGSLRVSVRADGLADVREEIPLLP